jgi:hydrogenase expression/formation protein HypE
MIIEEGFEIDDLARIVASMDEALGEVGANLVTGDTKVMEKGALDGIAINTSGIGIAEKVVRDNGLVPGDVIIVSGTLGDHGIAIMAHREGFDLGEQIRSDVAPLWGMMEKVLDAATIHAMKDPTRGGFASAINEMAKKSGVCIRIQEEKIPIRKNVRSAAAMLGIDPLEVANEGKVVMGVPPSSADAILAALHSHKYGKDAAVIGTVTTGAHVIMETLIGGERFIEPPIGDPVPRVC